MTLEPNEHRPSLAEMLQQIIALQERLALFNGKMEMDMSVALMYPAMLARENLKFLEAQTVRRMGLTSAENYHVKNTKKS